MIFGKKIQIQAQKILDISQISWCNSALLFRVKNGAGMLTEKQKVTSHSDYDYRSQLLLNGRPLIQAELPWCPTCTGILSAGYGIENICCPELSEIEENINSDFINIQHSFENLKPLFGLLSDGWYVLADIPAIPTDGEGEFFWNVSSTVQAVCQDYYHFGLMSVTEGFPAFLFATQSDERFNPERTEYYKNRMHQNNAPRAVAYHVHGFVSALLDGHHKAYACAELGTPVPTLTIIPFTTFYTSKKPPYQTVHFSGISIPAQEISGFSVTPPKMTGEIQFQKSDLIHHRFKDTDFQLQKYPDIDELALKEYLGLTNIEITPEMADNWMNRLGHGNWHDDAEIFADIHCAFRYFMRYCPENALAFAKKYIAWQDDAMFSDIWELLKSYRTPETEQLYITYLVNHDKTSRFWNTVCSYWDDVS